MSTNDAHTPVVGTGQPLNAHDSAEGQTSVRSTGTNVAAGNGQLTIPHADPEPYVIGDAGRSYGEITGGAPFSESAPPDTVCDAFDFQGWAVRAASLRGLQHRHGGTVRQDTYAVRFSVDTGRLVVVVCDGVGSESHSHLAADAAAAELARVTIDAEQAEIGSDEWWLAAYQAASERIVAEQGHLPERPMSTTATTVVLDGVGSTGPWPMTCAGVGDSSVWRAADTGTQWQKLVGGKDDDGPIHSTVVSALPFRGHERSVAVQRHDLLARDLLLVCSDGIGDAFADGTSAVAATLSEDWCVPPRALNFAAQIGFGRKGFVDDRTGVAIWAPGI